MLFAFENVLSLNLGTKTFSRGVTQLLVWPLIKDSELLIDLIIVAVNNCLTNTTTLEATGRLPMPHGLSLAPSQEEDAGEMAPDDKCSRARLFSLSSERSRTKAVFPNTNTGRVLLTLLRGAVC